ncbi:unnamed protein product, partial [Mesorhabditis spiculigera]
MADDEHWVALDAQLPDEEDFDFEEEEEKEWQAQVDMGKVKAEPMGDLEIETKETKPPTLDDILGNVDSAPSPSTSAVPQATVTKRRAPVRGLQRRSVPYQPDYDYAKNHIPADDPDPVARCAELLRAKFPDIPFGIPTLRDELKENRASVLRMMKGPRFFRPYFTPGTPSEVKKTWYYHRTKMSHTREEWQEVMRKKNENMTDEQKKHKDMKKREYWRRKRDSMEANKPAADEEKPKPKKSRFPITDPEERERINAKARAKYHRRRERLLQSQGLVHYPPDYTEGPRRTTRKRKPKRQSDDEDEAPIPQLDNILFEAEEQIKLQAKEKALQCAAREKQLLEEKRQARAAKSAQKDQAPADQVLIDEQRFFATIRATAQIQEQHMVHTEEDKFYKAIIAATGEAGENTADDTATHFALEDLFRNQGGMPDVEE